LKKFNFFCSFIFVYLKLFHLDIYSKYVIYFYNFASLLGHLNWMIGVLQKLELLLICLEVLIEFNTITTNFLELDAIFLFRLFGGIAAILGFLGFLFRLLDLQNSDAYFHNLVWLWFTLFCLLLKLGGNFKFDFIFAFVDIWFNFVRL